MRSRILFAALTLGGVVVAASCGSTDKSTPSATAATTNSITSASPAAADPTMPMDSSMSNHGSASMDTHPMNTNPMDTHPMDTHPMDTGPMDTGPMDTGPMDTGHMTTDGMHMGDAPPATGLSVQMVTPTFTSTTPADLSFRIVAADGSTVEEYEVEQTKELHLVLVRSDLTGYQHLHPTRSGDGTWTVPVTFEQGGTYRVVADFTPVINGTATGRTAITTDITVAGAGSDAALPAAATTANVDGHTVTIAGDLTSSADSELTFTVTDAAGDAAALEPYLGAFGHLVAFAQSDLAYTHIHPSSADEATGTLTFTGQVVAPGPHRLFMQFAADGSVHTAEFTVAAT